jgi:hypothetical protein
MKESEFIKLNFKFEISNFCANVKVKITSLRTTVWQLANTLTVGEFSKWIVGKSILRTLNRWIGIGKPGALYVAFVSSVAWWWGCARPLTHGLAALLFMCSPVDEIG